MSKMVLIFLLNLLFFRGVEGKENAVILILCRNSDMEGIVKSIESFENRFNKKFEYPYVFLNDKEFTDEFKNKLVKVCKNRVSFGKIDPQVWDMPSTVDLKKAEEKWKLMKESGVPYADMKSYHNMCRFYSKSFYKHDLLKNYEYYWRIEPNVAFHCDIHDDPFEFMKKNDIEYGFVISIYEYMNSIPTLFNHTVDFLIKYKNSMYPIDNLKFIYEDDNYNGCHFWSNFEIASFKFFRSKIYNDYMDYLDEQNGFYYERWGDAPVHTLAISLFLDKKKVYFFEHIGYSHGGITHCPKSVKNCDCNINNSIEFKNISCIPKYLNDKNN